MRRAPISIGVVIILAAAAYGILMAMNQTDGTKKVELGKEFELGEGETAVLGDFRITFIRAMTVQLGIERGQDGNIERVTRPSLQAYFTVAEGADSHDIALYPTGANEQDAYSMHVKLVSIKEGPIETKMDPGSGTEALIQHYRVVLLVTRIGNN